MKINEIISEKSLQTQLKNVPGANVKKDSRGEIRSISAKAGNTTMKQTFRPDSMPGYSQATVDAGDTTLTAKGSPETGYSKSAEYKGNVGNKNLKMKARQGYDGLDSGEVSLGNRSVKKVVKRATESASAGATGAGAIAVAPVAVGGYVQKRNSNGTAVNALDYDNLLGGKKKKKSKKSKA